MIHDRVTVIQKNGTAYREMLQCNQEIPPVLTPRFEFGNFLLLRLIPVRIRFIGGFARAHTLDYDGLWAAAQCTS